MKIRIVSIIDRGLPNKERLHLVANEPLNLAFYVVLNTSAIGEGVATGSLQSFWFGNQLIKAGDTVVLYSGSGTKSTTANANGSTSYFYYWNQKTLLWNLPAARCVVVEAANWQTGS